MRIQIATWSCLYWITRGDGEAEIMYSAATRKTERDGTDRTPRVRETVMMEGENWEAGAGGGASGKLPRLLLFGVEIILYRYPGHHPPRYQRQSVCQLHKTAVKSTRISV